MIIAPSSFFSRLDISEVKSSRQNKFKTKLYSHSILCVKNFVIVKANAVSTARKKTRLRKRFKKKTTLNKSLIYSRRSFVVQFVLKCVITNYIVFEICVVKRTKEVKV